jgi:putative transposon-encoded protein
MNDEKVRFSEIEIGELYSRNVRPSGSGAVINFLKRHIGKMVFIIVPKVPSQQTEGQSGRVEHGEPTDTSHVVPSTKPKDCKGDEHVP